MVAMRHPALCAGACVAALSLLPAPGLAYMAILRQGFDSAGFIEAGDRHGSALATGDFNGDGYDDLAVGAPLEDLTIDDANVVNTGAIVVSYGSPYGLTHLGAEYRYGCNSESFCEADMQFGYALAAGDFNHDGWDDLVVGAPYRDVAGMADAGEIFILLGSPTGLLTGFPLSQQSAGEINEPGDHFGASFAVGDFNGDSWDDLAVGAPGENSSGAVYYFIADPTGAAGLWGTTGWFKQSNLAGTDDVGDEFGYALAAGNLVGTGEDDLVASAPNRTVGVRASAGKVYLIRGAAGGLTATGTRNYSAGNAGGTQQNGVFGYALATGRFLNVGGYESIAVGEPGREVGHPGEGRVVVARGGLDDLNFSGYIQLDEHLLLSTGGDGFGHTLAAGAWNPAADAWDDLAVGAPQRDITGADDVGQVFLFYGAPLGPNATDYVGWDQGFVSDDGTPGDECGAALAFGNFDGYGRAGLAIGAPGKDEDDDSLDETPLENDAGYVLVIAPWRQVVNPGGRNALMMTPGDSIIYAERPFDRVRPASTTKVMTAILGLEGDLGFDYTVPRWVEEDVGGSTPFELQEGETISLNSLLYPMIMLSDNGAAYSIADVVSYAGTAAALEVCDFVDLMNARAGLLGMGGTHFSNPPGRDDPSHDCLDHYTTPADMVKLAQTAVADPLFVYIADTETHFLPRHLPGGATEFEKLFDSCLEGIRDLVPAAVLAKTGTTSGAEKALLFAASDGGTGYAVGGLYKMPMEYNGRCGSKTADLINLGLTRNGPDLFESPSPQAQARTGARGADRFAALSGVSPGDSVFMELRGLSTATDSIYGGSTELETPSDTTIVTVCLEPGSGPSAVRLGVARGSLAILDPGDVARIRFNPIGKHRGIRISNVGQVTATIQVQMTHPSFGSTYILLPRDHVVLPAFSGSGTGAFQLTISNLGANRPALEVEELGYEFTLTLAPGFETFDAVLTDGPKIFPLGMHVTTSGLDPGPGNTVRVLVHGEGAEVVGVPEAAAAAQLALRALPPRPNPFRTRTALRYALPREGRLEVSIFDVSGRRVRRLDLGLAARGEGLHVWDGSDHRGRRVANGVYLVRLTLDGIESAETRVVRLE
ncbi:MAG TPA: FlgD immunoglobulin-like domain containing protein [Candidatus Eisenbacteria bacterium]|jgi:hypothetical protein